jgi:hypothetical protein
MSLKLNIAIYRIVSALMHLHGVVNRRFHYAESRYSFQVIFLIVMTSAEVEWSFPDTLEGFGYAFNKGNRGVYYPKLKFSQI